MYKKYRNDPEILTILDKYDSLFRNIVFTAPKNMPPRDIYRKITTALFNIYNQRRKEKEEKIAKAAAQESETIKTLIYSGLNNDNVNQVKDILSKLREDDSLRKLLNIEDNEDIISCIDIS
jgi:hypothetical protein